MAIAVTFNFVIIRKAAIEKRFSGGIDAFRDQFLQQKRNRPPYGEDEHLVGFYSMGSYFPFDELQQAGIVEYPLQNTSFYVLSDAEIGLPRECDWLNLEIYNGKVNDRDGFYIVYLKGTEPGEVVEAKFC